MNYYEEIKRLKKKWVSRKIIKSFVWYMIDEEDISKDFAKTIMAALDVYADAE